MSSCRRCRASSSAIYKGHTEIKSKSRKKLQLPKSLSWLPKHIIHCLDMKELYNFVSHAKPFNVHSSLQNVANWPKTIHLGRNKFAHWIQSSGMKDRYEKLYVRKCTNVFCLQYFCFQESDGMREIEHTSQIYEVWKLTWPFPTELTPSSGCD